MTILGSVETSLDEYRGHLAYERRAVEHYLMATTRILSSGATPRRASSHAVVGPGLAVWTFRPRIVMAWTGRALLALGCLAIMLGVGWRSPEAVMASGAYAAGGLAMVLGSAVRL